MTTKVFIIFDGVVKERFYELKELTYEVEHDNLTYYFKNNTATKKLMILMMVQSFKKIW